jgi:hypothetical protein
MCVIKYYLFIFLLNRLDTPTNEWNQVIIFTQKICILNCFSDRQFIPTSSIVHILYITHIELFTVRFANNIRQKFIFIFLLLLKFIIVLKSKCG